MRNITALRRTTFLTLLLVFGLGLSACTAPVAAPSAGEVPASAETGETAAATGAAGTEIVVGIPAGFDRLDPSVTTFSRVGNITLHMTDPLVWQSEAGVFEPGLATALEAN